MYTAFGPKDQLYYNYHTNVQNWTGYTQLHAWLKVVTTDYTTIQGVEPRVDSNNYDAADYIFGTFVSGSTFSNGGWHETIVNLTAPYVAAQVNGFQFELQTIGTSLDGGAAPPPATLLVDSIWLE
jgi:hypothetical protein